MTILQLKYVIAIANSGSFREAASKLYVSQPALSSTIRELEEELDTQIFERTNKGVRLTESGIEFDFGNINRRGRHTMATFMNNAELDDKTIESQLGHYNVRFTRERYMNSQAKQEERGMDKLASYMNTL